MQARSSQLGRIHMTYKVPMNVSLHRFSTKPGIPRNITRSRLLVMEELLKKVLERNEATKKPLSAVPWKPDQPHAQPLFTYDRSAQAWTPAPPADPTPRSLHQRDDAGNGITRLRVYSWNIDFMLPLAKARMDAALEHLRSLTSSLPPSIAAVVFLQECVEEDLATIGAADWVRSGFVRTDVDGSNWQACYGTTTLVDRRLGVAACFRVHYAQTRMERDALFVDVVLNSTSSSASGGSGAPKTIRLCNSHLESLALSPPLRPAQVQVMATHMRAAGVHAGIAAGDFNAIEAVDRTLHATHGLRDAYLEVSGGREDSEEGYTWGQQAATSLRERFGCSRMDKVYFTSGGGLRLHGFERFGRDVLVRGEEEGERIRALGFEKPWITDHLGVTAEFEVVD
ncbi:Endonuclease/exonuclease/phosphatase [Daldinia caldariorum]|uniref:Endonuclease/exonuclease/phosphatase n=1 Tax=Daldinia caldariorum TaxID=326644 RepID=UPI0020086BE2|nr:Endonuclease/exonuclease/phosphatase [Daldinia caldariorum]KAI1464973.1 Endonuclease/exonuclease/phosphatase [Daldinia caldariorum]